MNIVIYIIIITNIGISYYAWQNHSFFKRYCLNPFFLVRKKQYERIITHAFLHGSWTHLLINMLVLWSFSLSLVQYLNYYFELHSSVLFLLLYFGAIIVASIRDIYKHSDDAYYNSVGASGATSAVVFASIFFNPWNKLYFFGVIPIPGIIFGIFYLVYSYKMAQKANDNIGHDAHFYGAIFGFFFFLILKPQLINVFIYQISNF
jgi:membrane associated rhomboid family serine protease